MTFTLLASRSPCSMLLFATWLHVRCPACVPCPASWCSKWVPECRQAGSSVAWARLSRTKVQVGASEQHDERAKAEAEIRQAPASESTHKAPI
ncbi:hypothetical protein AMECASPLE_022224 [Ameca splendens]|uniref:Secreted protein n=1 Tax=Ameca splendens TaxID=208324 RepID=A0ABV1AA49_9TELE